MFLRLAGLLLFISFLSCFPSGERPPAGVVVVAAGARTGLSPGDVLLSYRRGEAGGAVLSCADLSEIEIEQAPRGPVTLRVARGGRTFPVVMPAGEWKIEVRSEADPACAALARARSLAGERRWPEADVAFREAARRGRGRALFEALVLQERGMASLGREDFAAAERDLSASLRLRQKAVPGSLAEAASWHALGRLEQRRGEISRSEEAFRKALALRSRWAPGSLEQASTLNNLGIDAFSRGDGTAALRFYNEALAIVRRRAPGSLDEARVLNNLGLLARREGNLLSARRFFAAAGEIWKALDPESPDLTRNRYNLGLLALDRGDYAEAEETLREALESFEAVAPESVETAALVNGLGIVARERFDFDEANTLFRRALAIRHERIPGSADEAESLSNLAWVARQRGRHDEAERFARRALELRTRISPETEEVAMSLAILGAIAEGRGDLASAEELGGRALALERRIAPGTIPESDLLQFLGHVAFDRRDWEKAQSHLEKALAIRRRLAPGSRVEAETLDLLGLVAWRTGRPARAESILAAAVNSLEAQIERLGGSDESRSLFQSRFVEIYWDLIELQVERGEAAAALHTLERSRARSLLALLAQRDLVFREDVPAPLLARQRELDREYEAVQEEISHLDPRNRRELDALLVRLSRTKNERGALAARIARTSPHYASLRYPQPLDLAGVRRALDPGTVLLSYAVTDEGTFLFVVTPEGAGGGVRVIPVPIVRRALGDEVAVFRSLLLRGREDPEVEPALLAQGRKLYGLLIAPAAPWIAPAGRVLVSPDGPLHTLPFAALVRPGGAEPSYLAGWKPLHTVLSATLYAELRRGRREGEAAGPLVAFADPLYRPAPAGDADDSGAPPLARYRRGLSPLPEAREEVATLARLYGRRAWTYVGAEATEEQAKHPPVLPRYLHFACHALLDRRSPLDSALALAVPGPEGSGDNGLLQAWEVFEGVRIDADLVTLSACETGLGREAAGEGLIGLTRAFQYAGARSVLASLWAVEDRSTARLMERFYVLLREGYPKDAALAEAQRGLREGGGPSAPPYYWAAFELIGDWR